MTTQKAARASPELRKAPLSPRYRRNYTTPRGTTPKKPLTEPRRNVGREPEADLNLVRRICRRGRILLKNSSLIEV